MPDAFILVVESDDAVCALISHLLEQEGHGCVVAADAASALGHLETSRFDLVLFDIDSTLAPETDLRTTLGRLAADAPVILVVPAERWHPASVADVAGVSACVAKPVEPFVLRIAIEGALQRRALQRENLQLRSVLGRAAPTVQGTAPGQESLGSVPATLPRVGRTIDADWPTLMVLQGRYVDRVFTRTNGNRTHTARILGVDRRTVQRLFARSKRGK
jgi:two-component system nitrogen regulation response regulator NtrX